MSLKQRAKPTLYKNIYKKYIQVSMTNNQKVVCEQKSFSDESPGTENSKDSFFTKSSQTAS